MINELYKNLNRRNSRLVCGLLVLTNASYPFTFGRFNVKAFNFILIIKLIKNLKQQKNRDIFFYFKNYCFLLFRFYCKSLATGQLGIANFADAHAPIAPCSDESDRFVFPFQEFRSCRTLLIQIYR
jgi:hypothetical protein